MANHRSIVIIVNVKIDRWLAKTVKNPAVLHPDPKMFNFWGKLQCNFNVDDHIILPYCQSKAKLKYWPIEWMSIAAIRSKNKPAKELNRKAYINTGKWKNCKANVFRTVSLKLLWLTNYPYKNQRTPNCTLKIWEQSGQICNEIFLISYQQLYRGNSPIGEKHN